MARTIKDSLSLLKSSMADIDKALKGKDVAGTTELGKVAEQVRGISTIKLPAIKVILDLSKIAPDGYAYADVSYYRLNGGSTSELAYVKLNNDETEFIFENLTPVGNVRIQVVILTYEGRYEAHSDFLFNENKLYEVTLSNWKLD